MELKQNVYFVGARSFSSNKTNKSYNVVTLCEVDEKGMGTVMDQFVETMPELCKTAVFGDLFECVLDLENLSSKPRLKAVTKLIKSSPVVAR